MGQESCARRLGERFPRHFGEDVVNHAQLVRLISKLRRSVNELRSAKTCSDQIHPTVANISNKKKVIVLERDDETAELDYSNVLPAGRTDGGVKVVGTTTTTTPPSVSGQSRV